MRLQDNDTHIRIAPSYESPKSQNQVDLDCFSSVSDLNVFAKHNTSLNYTGNS